MGSCFSRHAHDSGGESDSVARDTRSADGFGAGGGCGLWAGRELWQRAFTHLTS